MENDNDFQEALASFRAKSSKTLEILYGGDGALVGGWREVRSRKGAKGILPVRNYGLCPKHEDFYLRLFQCRDDEDLSLKQFLFPVLRGEFRDPEKKMDCYLDALAELTVVGSDPTSALRFNILVNGNPVVENVIANGAIFATKLGSTGYFKSVARTIFTSGIGVGFICPTYSVPNIVVSSTDKIEFELARDAEIVVSGDKLVQKINAEAGWKLAAASAAENIAVFGYDHFMCPECRKNRNSTVVNDNYCIV